MSIDINIDQLTPCLLENKTGLIVETVFYKVERSALFTKRDGWNFNWKSKNWLIQKYMHFR